MQLFSCLGTNYLLILPFTFKRPLHNLAHAPIETNLFKVHIVLIMYKCFLPGHTTLSVLHVSTSFYSKRLSISSFPCCECSTFLHLALYDFLQFVCKLGVSFNVSSTATTTTLARVCAWLFQDSWNSVCFLLVGFYRICIFFFSLLLLNYVQDFLYMRQRLPDFHSVFVDNFYSTLVAK